MAITIAQEDIRDTNTYSNNIEIPGNQSAGVFQVDNGLDAEATVEFYGTREGDVGSWNDEIKLGEAVVGSTSNGYETLADPWEVIRVKITASSSPSSGTITVYKHGRA